MLRRLDTVGSTMDEARAWAEAGAPHLSAVQARRQLSGRGRGGRSWASLPGNLHLTVVCRLDLPTPRTPELGFIAGLALADVLSQMVGRGIRLKWPNDVLCGNAKLAGILAEALTPGPVLIGMGVNVSHCPDGLPYASTCLAELGSSVTADALADAVLEGVRSEIENWSARGFGDVLERWQTYGPELGSKLQVREGDGLISGRYAGLAQNGALLLDVEGTRKTIVVGDVAA